jgi:hypothetical protein
MSTKVTLGKHENSRRPVGLKLVKGSAHNREPAPFSDSMHNSLEVNYQRDPNAFYMPNEMSVLCHILLRIADFICDKTDRKYNEQKCKKLMTECLILGVPLLDEFRDAEAHKGDCEQGEKTIVKGNGHLL